MFVALWLINKATQSGNQSNSLLVIQRGRSAGVGLEDVLLYLAQSSKGFVFLSSNLLSPFTSSPQEKKI